MLSLAILTSQLTVQIVTIIILALSVGITLILTRRFLRKHSAPLLYWGIGMWLFVIGAFLEVLFASNIYSVLLMKYYLLIVALLVGFLAMGSMQLVKSRKLKFYYCIFFLIAIAFCTYTLVVSNIGNLITNYIVYGNLPLLVVISSSVITFPAAVILAVVAWNGYRATKNKKLLSIIAGVVIVSIAGTLYIIQFPAFLYMAEFVGILLLWYGFI